MDFGAKFEPIGNRILHGGGQDDQAFANYVQVMDEVPAVSIQYVSPHHQFFNFIAAYQSELNMYKPYCVLPQLGMHMNEDENPDKTYYEQIANGSYDKKLLRYLKAVSSLDVPIYLRIGLEFNGQWNGYTDPEIYVRAFRHVVDMIRENGMDHIAAVWCMNPGAKQKDYMLYYPGDDYVDWWAVDIFGASSMWEDVTEQFLADAEAHRKPVMLTECCPYSFNTQDPGILDGWMRPFFRFIQEHPVIKGMCYINWNWQEHGEKAWQHWGDSRIEAAASEVLTYYQEQMRQEVWLHAMTEEEVRTCLYGAQDLSVWEQ